jgi:hypothetical protein
MMIAVGVSRISQSKVPIETRKPLAPRVPEDTLGLGSQNVALRCAALRKDLGQARYNSLQARTLIKWQ